MRLGFIRRPIDILRILFNKARSTNVVILGIDYAEYTLCKALKKQGCNVIFFISQDPWKHNISFEGATCRYPSELYALCERHKIDYVYYCDNMWLDNIPLLPATTILRCWVPSNS